MLVERRFFQLYSPPTVVLLAEFIKLLISFAMLARDNRFVLSQALMVNDC